MKTLIIPVSLLKNAGVQGLWKKTLHTGLITHQYRNVSNTPIPRLIIKTNSGFTHDKIIFRVASSVPGNPNGAQGIEASKVEQETQPKPTVADVHIYLDKDVWRKIKKKQTDQYYYYTGNNFIEDINAKKDYLLDDKDLSKLIKMRRKSPYSSSVPAEENLNYIDIFFTKDVEKLAIEKWGSMENIAKERQIRKYIGETGDTSTEMTTSKGKAFLQAFGQGSGAVVAFAFLMNLSIATFKGIVWYFTRSPSMFSEFMHSFLDCSNQLLLAIGRYLSLKKPDSSHPYGYRNHLHIFPIASGVFIFSFGCGLTLYHSIQGFLNPELLEWSSLYQALMMLTGSFAAESASLIFAMNHSWMDAKRMNKSFWRYVKEHENPLVNVVLLEDLVAVLGVLVCGSAMGCSYLFSMPWIDAAGSLVISAMLGFVSVSLFRANAAKLLGKSLPYQNQIKKNMESDRFVQAVLDNKTIDMGDQSLFKSEVVLEAKLITQHFLNTEVDVDAMLVKFQSVKTTEDMERFWKSLVCKFMNK